MEEEKVKAQEEKIKKGKKGHGQGDNYEKFCKYCFIEYEKKSFENCTFCNKTLMPKEVKKFIRKNKIN